MIDTDTLGVFFLKKFNLDAASAVSSGRFTLLSC